MFHSHEGILREAVPVCQVAVHRNSNKLLHHAGQAKCLRFFIQDSLLFRSCRCIVFAFCGPPGLLLIREVVEFMSFTRRQILGGLAGLVVVGVGAGGASRYWLCLLYTSPSPRDRQKSRMPSSA